MSAPAPGGSGALEAFAARRETIAGDIAKLEKQVRTRCAWHVCGALRRARGGLQSSQLKCHSQPAPPRSSRPQIYELESVYFTADCTNFGNVVKARRPARRRRPSPPLDAAACLRSDLPLLSPPPCRASTSS